MPVAVSDASDILHLDHQARIEFFGLAFGRIAIRVTEDARLTKGRIDGTVGMSADPQSGFALQDQIGEVSDEEPIEWIADILRRYQTRTWQVMCENDVAFSEFTFKEGATGSMTLIHPGNEAFDHREVAHGVRIDGVLQIVGEPESITQESTSLLRMDHIGTQDRQVLDLLLQKQQVMIHKGRRGSVVFVVAGDIENAAGDL